MLNLKQISKFLIILILFSNIYATNAFIVINAERYDYNIENKSLQKINSRSIVRSISQGNPLVKMQIIQYPDETIIKYSDEIGENDFGLAKFSANGEETNLFDYDKRYDFLINPETDENGVSLDKFTFRTSIQNRISKKQDDIFELSQKKYTQEEFRTSPVFCMTATGMDINSIMNNDKINILISESSKMVSILALKLELKYDDEDFNFGDNYQLKKHIKKIDEIIEILFYYDINYKNTLGKNEILGRISPECGFQIPVAKMKIFDHALKCNIEKRFFLKGELFPIKHVDKNIELKGVFAFCIEYHDENGDITNTEFENIFHNNFVINELESTQINFTKYLTKDFLRNNNDNTKIIHSIFIKPVPNLSSTKDYFKPTIIINITKEDQIFLRRK